MTDLTREAGAGLTRSGIVSPSFIKRTLIPALVTALLLAAVFVGAALLLGAGAAHAVPTPPTPPTPPDTPSINIDIGGGQQPRSLSVTIILLMTVLSVAPSLLLMMTSFTKIAVVLALTRQAVGTPTIPPNQVIAGLALFLSLFVMAPVLTASWNAGVQPYLDGDLTNVTALQAAGGPFREFMLNHTGDTELRTMVELSNEPAPQTREDTTFTTLIPAFVISELKSAFIIGFVIYIPFLIIDLVVASILMSMGMMMLPPVMISLPFKLLLFVMVDGWGIITTALVTTYVQ
ncbi:MAG: flagellar type III secretion system pore protein FliP [Dermatophilus congolensis]|nr:flagellar type III secretion system pore protein FliP [Dermatophilus congolensis]